ncbi:hypothetical protein CCY99_04345 [Helicobacter sp. 16-1353]|uniref:YqiA/YcfP family alpha/beta fold hydrolase n=1 Tax=Helicobacter sp. 16-1353 TaxID=2004996 RepID=UPI000DCD761D|nr:YqiA/YcfP family alpha/beta fold hydrolase [Helicobacter sp. 16-1353]RAX54247.1 hypothetical protein CCY99_04345 [Helicobacter sp. 16-1353]
MKYFYLHGMHSSKGCDTYNLLSQAFSELKIIDLEYFVDRNCSENLDSLKTQILESLDYNKEDFILFGNSLGAFYALAYSAFIESAKICFLFNPVINPHMQLEKYIGKNDNKTTNTTFIFSKENLDSYKSFVKIPQSKLVVFLADNDELIDNQNSMEYFKNIADIVMFYGKHKIQDFKQFRNRILDEINNIEK